jgi:predicted outer membrane protein
MTAVRGALRGARWLAVGVLALVALSLVVSGGRTEGTAGDAGSAVHHDFQPVAEIDDDPETDGVPDDLGGPVKVGPGATTALSRSDVNLVVKVRLAGLWEMPAGQMAVEKGTTRRVRQVGAMIAQQHAELDALTVEAANQLGVSLPDKPNTDQQIWLDEMEAASGEEFDKIFVHRLRQAHGKIFPAIAYVRAGSRNDVVRRLAQVANVFVENHMTILESTNDVDYAKLERPPDPVGPLEGNRGLTAAIERSRSGGANLVILWSILGVALIAGAIGAKRFVRPQEIGGRRSPAPTLLRQSPGRGGPGDARPHKPDYDDAHPRRYQHPGARP